MLILLILARSQGNPVALQLAVVVFFAMMFSCTASGISGAVAALFRVFLSLATGLAS